MVEPESSRSDAYASVDHLFRHRSGQMVATLTRVFGFEHLDWVEDAVQDALVRALRLWPFEGVPRNPTAWLIQVAKNRVLDRLRRRKLWSERASLVERSLEGVVAAAADSDAAFAREVQDDQLEMIFACCDPAIPPGGRVALTLKTVGGFSTGEIARAFLSQPQTVAQRLVRAKRQLREGGATLQPLTPDSMVARIETVVEVLYLMFNEGYSALEGDDLVRSDLCREAIRLAELLAGSPSTDSPEVRALSALFYFHAARLRTRADHAGDLLLLRQQDRSQWDPHLLRRGLEHFRRSARGGAVTSYHFEAEIASCHALADSYASTDWKRILECYDQLLARDGSPVVAVNRAIALAEVEGAAAGLDALEQLQVLRVLKHYYPLYAARGELLRRLGRLDEAKDAYRAAQGLTSSAPVRRFLQARILESGEPPLTP